MKCMRALGNWLYSSCYRSVIKGHTEINLQKVQPENSKLEDLDGAPLLERFRHGMNVCANTANAGCTWDICHTNGLRSLCLRETVALDDSCKSVKKAQQFQQPGVSSTDQQEILGLKENSILFS